MNPLTKALLVLAIPCLLLLSAIGLGTRYAGIPLRGLDDVLPVGTGLAAKLACSGQYVSGFGADRARADVERYSPLLTLVDLRAEAPDTVVASVAGFAARARYYPGLGCTLQHPGMAALERVAAPVTAPAPAVDAWPAGEAVPPADAALQAALEAMLARDDTEGLDTRALLVVKNGQVAAEAYAPGIDAGTALLGWSMGKSVTALMVGRMEALGLLSVDEHNLFPAWAGDGRRAITLQNLLQMSSGLAFSEPYVPGNDSTRMLFAAPSASGVALASPLEHPPGTFFYYSSGTTNLLCRLLSDRLGGDPQALVDFFAREIATPLGLRHAVPEMDSSGVFVGSSFVYASARDWARLALPMLRGGRAGGVQWLPEGWVARASAPNPSANDPRYGYQFWLNGGGAAPRWPALPEDAYEMSGYGGQDVMLLPALDAIIVRLGWTRGEYPVNARFGSLLGLL